MRMGKTEDGDCPNKHSSIWHGLFCTLFVKIKLRVSKRSIQESFPTLANMFISSPSRSQMFI